MLKCEETQNSKDDCIVNAVEQTTRSCRKITLPQQLDFIIFSYELKIASWECVVNYRMLYLIHNLQRTFSAIVFIVLFTSVNYSNSEYSNSAVSTGKGINMLNFLYIMNSVYSLKTLTRKRTDHVSSQSCCF